MTFSHLRIKSKFSAKVYKVLLVCYVSQNLEQYLAHNRYSMNHCWIDNMLFICISNLISYCFPPTHEPSPIPAFFSRRNIKTFGEYEIFLLQGLCPCCLLLRRTLFPGYFHGWLLSFSFHLKFCLLRGAYPDHPSFISLYHITFTFIYIYPKLVYLYLSRVDCNWGRHCVVLETESH